MRRFLILLLIFVLSSVQNIMAQCAMCRATVGSNLSEGRNTIGTGLNFGILYLLVIPYLIVGLGVFFYIRAAKQRLREQGLA
jgi:large-conductance mechanosensitive channel